MSQENLEVVKRAADAFNRRDLQELAKLSDDDSEFVSVLTAVDGGDSAYRGPDLWASYFARMDDAWGDWHVENFQVFDAGDDRVVGIFRLVGKGKSSGIPVEQVVGLVYELRNRKLWRLRSYLDPSEALEAVGLSEQDARGDS